MRRVFAAMLLLLLAPITLCGRSEARPLQNSLKNRRVMVSTAGAEIRTREKGVVWRGYIGEVLTATVHEGDWLWIFERQGWLHRKHVVPFDTAVYEINARINKSRKVQNYALRGIAHLAHGNHEKALRDFNTCIRRNRSDAGAYVNRGNVYRETGRYKLAINDYSKAINLDNEHFQAMNHRAWVQMKLKNYSLALKDLTAAVALDDEYAEAHNNRGLVLQELGRPDEAMKSFNRAVEIYPRFVEALGNRADLHKSRKEYAAALRDLSAAVVSAPGSYRPLNDLAWFLATCPDAGFRDSNRALKNIREAHRIAGDRSWHVLDTYGAALAESGNFPNAIKWAEKALKAAPAADRKTVSAHLATYKNGKPIRD